MGAMRTLGWAAVVTMLGVAGLAGCSKSSNPTYPGGGGGGGGNNNAFDSGSLSAPATYEHVFPTAGVFGYHCTFHRSSGMVGTVTVQAGGPDSVGVTGSGMTFTPSAVTIAPGGKVHWAITGGTHTVTSN